MFSASKISISLFLVIRPAGSWTSYSSARARRAFHGELCESRHVVPPVWESEVMAGSPIPPLFVE